jgi:hypothetical protein
MENMKDTNKKEKKDMITNENKTDTKMTNKKALLRIIVKIKFKS